MNSKIWLSIIVFLVLCVSCKNKPEDACDCIQQTANEYMIKGIKITRQNELRTPCKSQIDAVKGDEKSKRMIIDCVDKVFENIESKTLFKIDGKSQGLPVYKFNNLNDFIHEVNKEGGDYKYLKTIVELENIFISKLFNSQKSFFEIDESDNSYLFAGVDKQHNNRDNMIVLKAKSNIINKSLYQEPFYLNENLLWDLKNNKYLEHNSTNDDFETWQYIDEILKDSSREVNSETDENLVIETEMRFMSNPYEYSEYVPKSTWLANRVRYIASQKGFSNFFKDLKVGNYKFINKEDFEKFAGKGIEEICLTKAKIKGVIYFNKLEQPIIELESIKDVQKLALPKSISETKKTYDFTNYLNK